MKIRFFFTFFLCLLLMVGCSSPPKREREKLPSQIVEPTKPQPPPEEKLREIVLPPQKEEAKTVQEKLFSFFARDSNIQDVLLAFSRESDLNLVINPEVTGKVTIDLKRVTLREALSAILTPLGWTYQIDGNLIRILRHEMDTRFFTVNYMATRRSGRRDVYASTGGGLQTGGVQTSVIPGSPYGGGSGSPSGSSSGQTGMAGAPSGTGTGYSYLVSIDEADFWREIHRGLETLIFGSAEEKQTTPGTQQETWTRADGKGKKLITNRSTGVIMVTDYPANLNRIASYLEAVEGSSQRQVSIQAKIFEVTLTDQYNAGINWSVIQSLPRSTNLSWGLTDRKGTTGFPGGNTGITSGTGTGTGTGTGSITTPGAFKIMPFGGTFAIGALGSNVALSDIMQAISQQGDVKVLSSPTISTLNNQKAIIRVGDQAVFFISGAVATQTTVTQIYEPHTIDIGIILDVTPQIAEDGTIIMNIHPSITAKTGDQVTPDGKTTFPLMSVRETDTTVRVRDGQTIIIAGLMQEKKNATYIGVPVLESFPWFGGLFKYKTETKSNTELVIMITPTLQVGKRIEDFVNR